MMLNFIFDVLFSVLCMHFIKFFFQIYVLSSFFLSLKTQEVSMLVICGRLYVSPLSP